MDPTSTRASSATGCLSTARPGSRHSRRLVPSIRVPRACRAHPGRLLHRRPSSHLAVTAVQESSSTQSRTLAPVFCNRPKGAFGSRPAGGAAMAEIVGCPATSSASASSRRGDRSSRPSLASGSGRATGGVDDQCVPGSLLVVRSGYGMKPRSSGSGPAIGVSNSGSAPSGSIVVAPSLAKNVAIWPALRPRPGAATASSRCSCQERVRVLRERRVGGEREIVAEERRPVGRGGRRG